MSSKLNKKVIALTGGIGSGKSTAISFFKACGAGIIDADVIAHDLLRRNTPAYHAIIAHFSQNILDETLEINRTKLRNIIFNDPAEKHWLETYLHPIIRAEMYKKIQVQCARAEIPYIILDIPLLKNQQDFPYVDRIVVIDCPETLQIARICQRNTVTKTLAKCMIHAQISRQIRNALADDYVLNDEDIDTLRARIIHLHQCFLAMLPNDTLPKQSAPE